MDVRGEDQSLHDVFGRDLGIDNDALDFQQLEEYISNGANMCFPDEPIQALAYSNNGRPQDPTDPANLKLNLRVNTQPPTTQHQIAYCPDLTATLGYTTSHHVPLPDSPPDSGSEPYSPPDGHHHQLQLQDSKSSLVNGMTSLPPQPSGPPLPQPTTQPQPMYAHHRPLPAQHHNKGFTSYLSNEPPKLNHLPPTTQPPLSPLQHQISHHYIHTHPPILPPHYAGNMNSIPQQQQQPPPQQQQQQQQPTKKRKHSDSPTNTVTSNMLNGMNGVIKQEPPGYLPDCDEDYGHYDMGDSPGSFMDGTYQVIKWQAFQPTKWSNLCDEFGKELPTPSYRVDADKGFNFSVPDDSFVCQKKNHFQVTVHIGVAGAPRFVRTQDSSIRKVDNYYLHFHGIKMESTSQTIKIEQSQSDRSKKSFHPVKIDLPQDQVTKLTVGRLHFSETTANNMRKKGKPNPDQRYFMLVVSLHAHSGDQSCCIASHVSERIIVRASNPGQFEGDVDVLWQKGHTNDSVYHVGRVGVNTDHPDEAITVHGNIKLTGHIVQPSDIRAKEDLKELDSKEQLRNVSQMRIYKYQYSEDFAAHAGLSDDDRIDTGIIAQEVQEVLPDAVRDTGDVLLSSGHLIDNFLVVNKDRIYMENVGAVKELCKLTDNLEIRIDELEKMNTKLTKLKRYDSIKSTMSTKSGSSISTVGGSLSKSGRKTEQKRGTPHAQPVDKSWCSNKFIQITIIVLILIMAFCLVAITVLYILERHKSATEGLSTGGPLQNSQHTAYGGQTVSPWMTPPTTGIPRAPNRTQPSSSSTTATTTTRSPVKILTTIPSVSKDSSRRPVQKIIPPLSRCTPNNCEVFCCPRPQDDGPVVYPHRGDNPTLSLQTTKGPDSVNPESRHDTYNIGTNKTSGVEVVIHPGDGDIPNVITNDQNYVIQNNDINANYVMAKRRRRREEPLDQVEIMIQELNFTIDSSFCTPDGCEPNNKTYKMYISCNFNPVNLVTLRFSFSANSPYTPAMCSHYEEESCPSIDTAIVTMSPSNSMVGQKNVFDWKLNIGRHFKTIYKFRVSQSETPCEGSSGGEPSTEYNIQFERQCPVP